MASASFVLDLQAVRPIERTGPETCCLCGKPFREVAPYGRNNPWPAALATKNCCDDCNGSVVIPARTKSLSTYGLITPATPPYKAP